MPYTIRVIILCLLVLPGCADLRVRKISAEDHACDKDCVKGFRYYLSRPYILVKNPVPVSEEVSLLVLNGVGIDIFKADPASALAASQVSRVDPQTRNLTSVSEAELQDYRRALAALPAVNASGNSDGTARTNTTGPGLLADTSVNSGTGVAALGGEIQVVYLPDFDEQYAVHNRNLFGQSSYALNFVDGWQLSGVGGEFDSTTVALELLNTINSAIDAAKTVRLAQIGGTASSPGNANGVGASQLSPALKLNSKDTNQESIVVEVVRQTYLKPGLYRINKPWEIANAEQFIGVGLLAKLGLDTYTISTVRGATPQALQVFDDKFDGK